MKRLMVMVCAFVAAGCTPYNSTYMCEASRDYGKCSDVKGAYVAALGASPGPERIQNRESKKEKGRSKDKKVTLSPVAVNAVQAQDMYRAREYQQLAALLEQPTVPLVKMPTALRTLVVSYSSGKTLYMPRYIYFLDDEANFVFGDYLTPRDSGGPMIFPNSAGQGVTSARPTTSTTKGQPQPQATTAATSKSK